MNNRAFICQVSEEDWFVSRKVGVYGNREGSEKRGEIKYFAKSKKGDQTIQSIIEDLIGMKKGDIIFFHVIGAAEGESSIHGVYRVRNEPFYNDKVRLWSSSPYFVYPYRFCFEPHPEHTKLCKYDASILVSELYTAIENRNIRSILTLEREVRGAAHAVKTITRGDAKEIVKLLYRDFHHRRLQQPIKFRPRQMKMPSLRKYIKRIGEIEFAVKALVAYELGRENQNFIKHIPACRNTEYDFLIETFIGQTMRKPVDLLCVGSKESEKIVTIIEAKTDLANIDHLVQLLKYQEMFKIRRNIDRDSLAYKFSSCLLAKRFHQELINYASARNVYIPWEEIILLKYAPSRNGESAVFTTQTLPKPTHLPSKNYPRIKTPRIKTNIRMARSKPEEFYYGLGKKIPPKTSIELFSSEENVTILRKCLFHNKQKVILGDVLIYVIYEHCADQEFIKFMDSLRGEAEKYQGDLMVIEPILIAEDYDNLIRFFLEQYNRYETRTRRQPISAYTLKNC